MASSYSIPKAGDTKSTISRRLQRLIEKRDKLNNGEKKKYKKRKKAIALEVRDQWAKFQGGKCLHCKNEMKNVYVKYSQENGNIVGVVCERLECRTDKNFEFFSGEGDGDGNGG